MEQALIGLHEKINSLNVHVFSWEFSKSSAAQLEMGGYGLVMFPRGKGKYLVLCRGLMLWDMVIADYQASSWCFILVPNSIYACHYVNLLHLF